MSSLTTHTYEIAISRRTHLSNQTGILQVVVSEESRKLTAYHEGGHAIVALNTAGAHPIHKATITPRGNSLGMVTQVPSSVRP
jgi:ATP-dependent Zn protease